MKKYYVYITILVFCILILLITSTYSLFETNATGNSDFSIGRWDIRVNNHDIALTEEITLNDFVFTNTGHTESGYFSPGSSAEFEVIINASNTDVAIDYTLEIADNDIIEDHPNISFRVQNEDTLEEVTGTTFSGTIPVGGSNNIIRLKIYLDWIDNSLYDLNDNELIGEDLEFVINANFVQKIVS